MVEPGHKPAAGERLAKVMARHGVASRRQAEQWIRDGRVTVNGKKVITPAFTVTGADKVEVDEAPLVQRAATRVWLYHKPAGLVVTENDPEGRPTIFEKFREAGLPRVLTVGRLDINTEGLLLLTNDGGLKRVLELPSTGWLRRYRVRAHGTVTQADLDRLKSGTEVEGVRYGPIDATLERVQGSNVWLLVALREGKNREVKNVLSALGLTVNRLIRVSYGPFQLGDLPSGQLEAVRTKVLRDQLGKRLAEEAGVDFEGPIPDAESRPVRRPSEPDARGPARSSERPPKRGAGGAPGQSRERNTGPGFPARGGERGDRNAKRSFAGDARDRKGPFKNDSRGRQDDSRGRQNDFRGRRDDFDGRKGGNRSPKIHFDDGRPSEDYVPADQRPDRPRREGGRPGDRPQRDRRDTPRGASRGPSKGPRKGGPRER